ncbi:MAG: hypothetical protein R2715_02575 [Ilumatobacteraceae bacterium]
MERVPDERGADQAWNEAQRRDRAARRSDDDRDTSTFGLVEEPGPSSPTVWRTWRRS